MKTKEASNKGVMSPDEITALGNEMSSVEEKVSFLNTVFVAYFVLRWNCSLIIVHKRIFQSTAFQSKVQEIPMATKVFKNIQMVML